MRGYKAFNKDLTCRGMQYEIGKEFVFEGKLIPCKQGFHFCETIGDCYKFYKQDESVRICEVEATGDIVEHEYKHVTNRIKILREITNKNLKKGNTGNNNTGYLNSGDENYGNINSGDRNYGNWNSGNSNIGDCNTGSKNSGFYNSGDYNSGDRNSGHQNSGFRNSGMENSGDWNSGNKNSGDANSGDRNSGIRNSGDWNSGNRSSGVFNTEKKPTIKMFDKESPWTYNDWFNSRAREIMAGCPHSHSDYISKYEITDEEKENRPECETTGGYVKTYRVTTEERQKWWDNLSEDDKNEVKALPNFDGKKFCECVGIEHI